MQQQEQSIKKINCSQFKNKIDEDFDCTICTDILYDPVLCKQCEVVMCRSCIEGWNEKNEDCPNCRKKFEYQKPQKDYLKFLNKQELECNKCDKPFKYEFFLNHDCKKKEGEEEEKEEEKGEEEKQNDTELGGQQQQQQQQQNQNQDKNLKFIKRENCGVCQDFKMKIMHYEYPSNVWFCDKCQKRPRKQEKDKQIMYHCTTCNDYDICFSCVQVLNVKQDGFIQIKTPKCEFKTHENCSKDLVYTTQPYYGHELYNGIWYCEVCKGRYEDGHNFQCKACEYDVCLSCLDYQNE